MSDIAVRTVGLSKEYRLATATRGVVQYNSLREKLTELGKAPARAVRSAFGRGNGNGKPEKYTRFWALKDVSLEVKNGEAVGLIGRNGAGKSTLLKILSRITDPTGGYAEVAGRVGSLLEVGTGFHPELTGRENIYLNGAILGMRRAEIERKFDEIVSFAEVEKFLDTPVKHYSSGMYLRLGFAVAAHLEPEILMVDEVLAVGDAAFQKKCLGKMDEVAHQGRTVLFVSHNMPTISQLCTKTVVLDAGSVVYEGDAASAINYYVRLGSTDTFSASLDTTEAQNRSGSGAARIVYAEIKNESGAVTTAFGIGEPMILEVQVVSSISVPDITLGVDIKTTAGLSLMHLRSDSQGIELGGYEAGIRTMFRIRIPGLPFYPDIYVVEPWMGATAVPRMDHLHNLLRITLEATGRFECEKMIFSGRGLVVLDCDWKRLPGVR